MEGIFRDSLEYRHRSKRRPVGMRYHADMGRAGYRDAAANRLARLYKLEDLFLRFALQFGKYRTGTDRLVTDAQGESRISAGDHTVAMIDELLQPQHVRQRFTVAY